MIPLAAPSGLNMPMPQSPKSRPSSIYRPEIDGLRAVAVIAVLLNHFFHDFAPGGYLGVDLFFALSGYVVTRSLKTHDLQHRKLRCGFLSNFYARRIRRLYPALLLMTVSVALLSAFFLQPSDFAYQSSWRTGLAAIWGSSNIQLWRTSSDYFSAPVAHNLFTHTWSLGVEEQFYLLFPLFWALVTRAWRPYLLAFLTSASWILFVYSSSADPLTAFYLMPSRFWEIGAGSLISLLEVHLLIRVPFLQKSWLLIFAFGLLISSFLLPSKPGLINAGVVMLTCLLILGLTGNGPLRRCLSSSRVVLVGVLSYSLYLWHWPLLLLTRATIAGSDASLWSSSFAIVLTALVAWLSYRFVEQPMRIGFLPGSSGRALLGGGAMSFLGSALLWSVSNPFAGILFLGKKHEAGADVPHTGAHQAAPPDCNLFATDKASSFQAPGCPGLPSVSQSPTLFILGDSHAEQFYLAAKQYASRKGWGLRIAIANSCPFPPTALADNRCLSRQLEVQSNLFAILRRNDVVLIASSWLPAISKSSPHEARVALRAIDSSLKRVVEEISDRNARVILYLDGPQFFSLGEVPPQRCVHEWFRPSLAIGCELSVSQYLKVRQPLQDLFHNYKGRVVEIWDPLLDHICPRGICTPTGYLDGTHYSLPFADYLFNRFTRRSLTFNGSTPF